MIWVLLGGFLLMLAGVSEAIMDTLAHHRERSIFKNLNLQFWDVPLSSSNKWKNGDKEQGEKFFLSSTLLVFATQAWHVFKMIRNVLFFMACPMVFYNCENLLQVVIFAFMARFVLFGGAFTICYKKFQDENIKR